MRLYSTVLAIFYTCFNLTAQQSTVFKEGYAKMKEGDKVSFYTGSIKGDKFYITTHKTKELQTIMLDDIELIQHKLRNKVGEGAALGFAIGAGISLLAILSVNNDSSRRLNDNWYVPLGGLTALTTLIGGLNGSKRSKVETIYEPQPRNKVNMGLGVETYNAVGSKLVLGLRLNLF